jgi:hypothetical protein
VGFERVKGQKKCGHCAALFLIFESFIFYLGFQDAYGTFRTFRLAGHAADAIILSAGVKGEFLSVLLANFKEFYRADFGAVAATLAFFQINLNCVHRGPPIFVP